MLHTRACLPWLKKWISLLIEDVMIGVMMMTGSVTASTHIWIREFLSKTKISDRCLYLRLAHQSACLSSASAGSGEVRLPYRIIPVILREELLASDRGVHRSTTMEGRPCDASAVVRW